jgi:hypothetical protein
VHLLLLELVRNLTQVKCGAGKAIPAGDNETIPFPALESWSFLSEAPNFLDLFKNFR